MTAKRELPVLILGAGLAGLSAAYHLRKRPCVLVERESEVGGLCRSVRRDRFVFDYTGHLLHMRRPEIRELVFELMGEDAFLKIDRRSGIYSHGAYTEYPFQVNTHGLPLHVIRECVMGFAATLQKPGQLEPDADFHQWALSTFGEGIFRHFMQPYNEKLLRTDLRTVTSDWVSWSIPKPTWDDVVRGALGTNRKAFGYNPNFLYPAEGGIDHLPKALLKRLPPPVLSTDLVEVDTRRRRARLSNGQIVEYSSAISTIPIPELIERIRDVPQDIREAARALRYVSVLNLNLGFDAACPEPYQWVYFPEHRFPFYRVGVYSNLCPATVPPGHSGFYVEISTPPGSEVDVAGLVEDSRLALRAVGLVPDGANVVSVQPIHIRYAYVIHDSARSRWLPILRQFLAERDIVSIGRYGAWEYSAMEDALWQGRVAALQVTGTHHS